MPKNSPVPVQRKLPDEKIAVFKNATGTFFQGMNEDSTAVIAGTNAVSPHEWGLELSPNNPFGAPSKVDTLTVTVIRNIDLPIGHALANLQQLFTEYEALGRIVKMNKQLSRLNRGGAYEIVGSTNVRTIDDLRNKMIALLGILTQ